MRRISFSAWLDQCDAIALHLVGMTTADYDDWSWADAYDQGLRPVTAVRRSLRAAGWEG